MDSSLFMGLPPCTPPKDNPAWGAPTKPSPC